MSRLKTNFLGLSPNKKIVELEKFNVPGYFKRQIISMTEAVPRTATNTWALGPTFPVIPDFKKDSLILLYYCIPMRNDHTSWGGGYIEPQIRFNEGAWKSLGSSGFDGGCMSAGTYNDIGSYRQEILLTPTQLEDYSLQLRFYYSSHEGTVNIFGQNNINNISGTAPLLEGNVGLQHATNVVITEYARYN